MQRRCVAAFVSFCVREGLLFNLLRREKKYVVHTLFLNVSINLLHIGQIDQIDHDLDQIDQIDHDLDQIDHDLDQIDANPPL